MMASCLRRSGNYQKAFELYRQTHNKFPENIQCMHTYLFHRFFTVTVVLVPYSQHLLSIFVINYIFVIFIIDSTIITTDMNSYHPTNHTLTLIFDNFFFFLITIGKLIKIFFEYILQFFRFQV